MPGSRFVASLVALLALIAATGAAPAAHAAQPGATAAWSPHTSGPHRAAFRCAGRWAPIQAEVSGFVIGNCRGGTAVRGIALDACAPGCIRGAASEGRAWAAVSVPSSSHFFGCGWMNVTNRLVAGGAPPRDRCGSIDGPDMPRLSRYVKRFTGRSLGGARLPTSTKYAGSYVWAGHFTSGANRGHEGGGMRYRPRFASAAKTCPAYANVNPWLPWQRVRAGERMWSVHDRSPHLTIRYIARFQAADPAGHLQWWVNVHSSAATDRAQSWGFIAASCLFDSARTTRAQRAPQHRQRRTPATKCGFEAVPFHEIVARRGLSCGAAKTALRALRGSRALAPIACHAARTVRGWRLTNLVRDPSLGITRFRSRHHGSFDFERHQFPGEIWCPA